MARTHGEAGKEKTPEYRTWSSMINRCTNPNNRNWPRYGGRGIKVCERWRHSYPNFLADMGRRPTAQHTIDRYPDNDGNYEPGNCRWATTAEQNRNTRNRVFVTVNGVTKRLYEWAEITGASTGAISSRLKSGMPPELAITGRRLILGEGIGKAPLTIGGVSDTVVGWAQRLGINGSTLAWRLRHGFTAEQAISQPKFKARIPHGGQISPGERNGSSKLTAEQVIEIRRLRAAGVPQPVVAARFGCSTSNVRLIEKGKGWTHLKGETQS